MDTDKTIKLIKEFEIASKATEEMLTSMDGFKEVLRKYYESYREIADLRDTITNNGVVGKVSDVASELNTINEQIAANVSKVNESIEQIKTANTEGLDRISHIDASLKSVLGVFDEIRDTISKVVKLNDAIEKSMVFEIDAKFQSMSSTFNRIEKQLQAFDSSLSIKLNNIESTILKNHDQIEEYINQSGMALDQTSLAIGQSSKTFENSNERLIKEVQIMADMSSQLKMAIEKIYEQNQDGIEAFSKLADEWASKSIHGMAIKKKSK